MYILSPKQLMLADKATIEIDEISAIDLMEHAANLCFEWLHTRLQTEQIKIHVFCGIGNNGGDGLVIARKLFEKGYNVNCYIVNFSTKRTEQFLDNYTRLKDLGVWPITINSEKEFPEVAFEDIVIDAIFGIGLTRKPTGFTKKLIKYINSTKVFVLAIDFPSGLFGNIAVEDPESVLKAGHVLSFQTPKLAILLPENKDYLNTWEVLNIGLNEDFIESLKPKIQFITKFEIRPMYKPRSKWSHKGNFGHALIIGGSYGKIGAITLATKAALTIGSGLVTSYIPKCGYSILQISVPEAMVEVDNENTLTHFNYKTKATVIGIGPGMGTHEKTAKGFEKFLKENQLPLVIDADGINLLAKDNSLLAYLPKKTVITPHPKELMRLIGTWKNDYDKLEKTVAFSEKHELIVVLKGTYTTVIDGDTNYFNSTGNPALASGGSGDVLTGIITGLIAQGYTPKEAAIFGVFLHGRTADIAVQETGHETFIASSILDYLPDAILDLFAPEKHEESSDKNEENEADEDTTTDKE